MSSRPAPLIARPLVLVGAPRSGTTMIFQALSAHPDLWSLYRESQAILERHFHARLAPGVSSAVTAEDVDDATVDEIRQEFFDAVGNVEGGTQLLSRGLPLILRSRMSGPLSRLGRQHKKAPIRIVEKTPDNCFRLQMVRRVFPDAQFVYVLRDPRGSIASIYHGWKDEARFQRYDLPEGFTIRGYDGRQWCFGIPPHWERLSGCTLIEVCAEQWISYNEHCLRDLPDDPGRTMRVRYEELSSEPGPVLDAIAAWAGLDPAPFRRFREKLPVVNTWTKPSDDKWLRFEAEISTVLDRIEEMSTTLGYRLDPSTDS